MKMKAMKTSSRTIVDLGRYTMEVQPAPFEELKYFFIRWIPNGSIKSTILKEALEEIDNLGVLPRVNSVKPYLLVDGNGSRFSLDFILYINDPAHEWVVCIVTPYGTALW